MVSALHFFAGTGYLNKQGTIHNTGVAPFITFTENKGQVCDQNKKARPDILFSGSNGHMVYHLRSQGISYQLSRNKHTAIDIYRLDVNWLGANKNASVQKDEAIEGYDNYYSTVTGIPATFVKTYKGLTYRAIYQGIDLHYYSKSGDLKYDFLVAANADYRQIQMQVNGATDITRLHDGSIACKTPFGEIIEGAPLVYQNGRKINSKWVIEGNKLSFEIEKYNPSLPLVIDPATRTWGTYYGASVVQFLGTNGNGCSTDANGNIYFVGLTDASGGTGIATSGSHQSTLSGGTGDAFLVKFNSAGVRQWGTYYGGVGGNTNFNTCTTDAGGNVYAVGFSVATAGISTPGSHQSSLVSGSDAILVKFNSAGVRQWGTYYGDSGTDDMSDVTVDGSGNLFIVGRTSSPSGIATPGSHQNTFGGGTNTDAFLAKFNSNGVRQWCTYYGGSGSEFGYGVGVDANGNPYIAGSAASTSGISTPGSHQSNFGGGATDGFVAKFNTNGVRQWGTYYGGSGDDNLVGCDVTPGGDVFAVGTTGSSNGIASNGAYQTVFGGGPTGQAQDAFVVKLNSGGTQQWGSYFGGSGTDRCQECVADQSGNVIIVGETSSSSGIATVGSHQTVFAGGTASQPFDAFVAKFAGTGSISWATYYGGSSRDVSSGCAIDNTGTKIYLSGSTQSNGGTAIATTGAHQTSMAAANDAFIVQFTDCVSPVSPVNTTAASGLTLCANASATLSASAAGPITWYNTLTSATSLSIGSVYITPLLSGGTYTYYAETSNTCSPSSRTPITVTVSPQITVNSGSVCIGGSFTMVPAGVTSFTFSNGNAVVSPSVTTNYTVTGVDQTGCSGSAVSSITVNPLPTVTVNSGTLCSGASFTLQASGATTYTYSSTTPIVTPTANTTYTVTGASSGGCLGTAISNVTVNSTPKVTVVSSKSLTCKGAAAVLTASGAATYSWSNGSKTATISINPTVTTTYSVAGTGTNGCSMNVAISQSVATCTGLLEAGTFDDTMFVYPNPGNGSFGIRNTAALENGYFEIYNVLGELVWAEKTGGVEIKFNIARHPAGVYFVNVIESTQLITRLKLVKE